MDTNYCQCEDCQRPCKACGAEPFEMCRVGCLGYVLDNDLIGTEPCS